MLTIYNFLKKNDVDQFVVTIPDECQNQPIACTEALLNAICNPKKSSFSKNDVHVVLHYWQAWEIYVIGHSEENQKILINRVNTLIDYLNTNNHEDIRQLISAMINEAEKLYPPSEQSKTTVVRKLDSTTPEMALKKYQVIIDTTIVPAEKKNKPGLTAYALLQFKDPKNIPKKITIGGFGEPHGEIREELQNNGSVKRTVTRYIPL